MLLIKTHFTEDKKTHVEMEFRGGAEELLNAVDSTLKSLAQCIVDEFDDNKVYALRQTFIERFMTHFSVAIDKKLKGGNNKTSNTEIENS